MDGLAFASLLPLAAWLTLLLARGGFWRADQTPDEKSPPPLRWPAVAAVIPARDEAATIGRTVASLLGQDYPGSLTVTVVDDDSSDGTAAAAGIAPGLTVMAGRPLPPGWAGKVWALAEGVEVAAEVHPDARYFLFTDADVEHDPASVRRLVAKAEAEGLDLVSLMVKLRSEGAWERLLIPAYVFFFQKLYPFAWVNDRRRRTAAAAGGCMLVRQEALARIGGMAAIRDCVIDDCALAAAIKGEGAIWLGLSATVQSLRRYDRLGEVWAMVARSAFTQLRHSPLLLAATIAGMVLIYLGPPVALAAGVAAGAPLAALSGGLAWLLSMLAYAPTLALYGQRPWRGLLLPAAAFLFTLMTLDSARRHWLGAGAAWKGRRYRAPSRAG